MSECLEKVYSIKSYSLMPYLITNKFQYQFNKKPSSMKMIMATCLVFFICPFFVNANIWDNLFLGQGVAFRLPGDFSMTLSVQQQFGKALIKVIGSVDMEFLSISFKNEPVDFLEALLWGSSDLLNLKLFTNQGKLYLNSVLKECLPIKEKILRNELAFKFQQYMGLLTLLVSVEKEGGYYKLETVKLLDMIDTSAAKVILDKIDIDRSFIKQIPELVFYFDIVTTNLKKVDVQLDPDNKYTIEVVELKPYTPSKTDLSIPQNWHCERETIKPFKYLDIEEILGDIKRNAKDKFPLQYLLLETLLETYGEPLKVLQKLLEDLIKGSTSS